MRAPGFLLFSNKKMKIRLTHQDAIRRGPGTRWNRGGMNVHCVSPVHLGDRKERGSDRENRGEYVPIMTAQNGAVFFCCRRGVSCGLSEAGFIGLEGWTGLKVRNFLVKSGVVRREIRRNTQAKPQAKGNALSKTPKQKPLHLDEVSISALRAFRCKLILYDGRRAFKPFFVMGRAV